MVSKTAAQRSATKGNILHKLNFHILSPQEHEEYMNRKNRVSAFKWIGNGIMAAMLWKLYSLRAVPETRRLVLFKLLAAQGATIIMETYFMYPFKDYRRQME